MITSTFTITDLRHNTNDIIDSLADNNAAYIMRNSKHAAVIVDVDYLHALESAYEDMLDAKNYDRGHREIDQAIPFDQFISDHHL